MQVVPHVRVFTVLMYVFILNTAFLLQLLHGLDGFVHTGKGLLFDEAHTSAFVYDNQVINSLHGVSFFRILDFVVSLSMLLSIIRNEKGKN